MRRVDLPRRSACPSRQTRHLRASGTSANTSAGADHVTEHITDTISRSFPADAERAGISVGAHGDARLHVRRAQRRVG
jgi:hypothetical protein